MLGIEHPVRHTGVGQQRGNLLGVLDRTRAGQHRLTDGVACEDLAHCGRSTGLFAAVQPGLVVHPNDRPERRNRHHRQSVNGLVRVGVGDGDAGHRGQPQEAADADPGQGLDLGRDGQPFLRGQCDDHVRRALADDPAGVPVDQPDLVAIDDVVAIASPELLGGQRCAQFVAERRDSEQSHGMRGTGAGQLDLAG